MSSAGILFIKVAGPEDLLLSIPLHEDGTMEGGEWSTEVFQPGISEEQTYLSGRVPRRLRLNLEGTVIEARLQAELYPMRLRIILEYSEPEHILQSNE